MSQLHPRSIDLSSTKDNINEVNTALTSLKYKNMKVVRTAPTIPEMVRAVPTTPISNLRKVGAAFSREEKGRYTGFHNVFDKEKASKETGDLLHLQGGEGPPRFNYKKQMS